MDYSTEMSFILNDIVFFITFCNPLGKGMEIYFGIIRNLCFAKSAYNLQIYWLEYKQALFY